jgi:hypothetical protein
VIVCGDGRGIANDGQPYENSYAWFMKLRDGKPMPSGRGSAAWPGCPMASLMS